MKLVRTTLLGAAASLLALGGVASGAQAAENPADPILCTVTSPDPSTCAADPGDGGESGPGGGSEPAQSEEDPLCGLTAGLVCAPDSGGGEEPPGGPGGGPEEPPGGPGGGPEEPPSGPSGF